MGSARHDHTEPTEAHCDACGDVPCGSSAPWWRRVTRSITSWTLTIISVLVILHVVGQLRAPHFEAESPLFSAQTTTGAPFALSDLRGRPVLLNFWATWCTPCRLEAPALSRFAARHPEIAVIGVVSPTDPRVLDATIAELGIDYPIVLGTRELLATYEITTFPTTLLIDATGKVISAHVGLMLDPQLEWVRLSL